MPAVRGSAANFRQRLAVPRQFRLVPQVNDNALRRERVGIRVIVGPHADLFGLCICRGICQRVTAKMRKVKCAVLQHPGDRVAETEPAQLASGLR